MKLVRLMHSYIKMYYNVKLVDKIITIKLINSSGARLVKIRASK